MKKLFLFLFVISFVFAQDIAISTASMNQQYPCVASDGEDFMVMWEDSRVGTSNKNIYAQPIMADGTVPIVILPTCIDPGNQTKPAIAYSGSDFLTLWNEADAEISGRFSTYDGLGTGPFGVITLAENSNEISMLGTEDGYFATWNESGAIIASFIDADGETVGDYFMVAYSDNVQSNPDCEKHSDVYVIVYEEARGSVDIVMCTYRDADGGIYTSPFEYGSGERNPSDPAVASSGSEVLSVFVVDNSSGGTSMDIVGQLLTPDGFAPSFDIITSVGPQQKPCIVYGDGAFLLVYEDFGSGYFADIKGQWISSIGTVIDTPFVISSEMAAQSNPKLAYGNGNFLAVWGDRRGGSNSDIYGQIIDNIEVPSGPVASIIEPTMNSYTTCENQEIILNLFDADGVDVSTCILDINGTTYTSSSSEVSFAEENLIFTPSIPWSDGELINCQLLECEDIFGTPLVGTVTLNFSVDFTSPSFASPSPASGATIPSLPSMITINVFDDGSGLDETTLRLTWDELDLTYPHPALYWNGTTFAILLDSLDIVPTMPENEICVYVSDSPDYCSVNMAEFCWGFYNESKVDENFPSQKAISTAYPNPFNAAVEISFTQYAGLKKIIEITDLRGREITTIESSTGTCIWIPKNCESAVYFYSIQGTNLSGKLLYTK